MVIIYHNPRCSKSRAALDLLKSKGLEPQVVEYLKTPPSAKELGALLKKLGVEPQEIVRTKEALYQELGLKERQLSRAEMIQVLVGHPVLMERPIVVNGEKAVVGRPTKEVLKIF